MKQLSFLKKYPSSYGGTLLKRRKGRRGPRPIDTKATMHLVLSSTQAKGEWSFRRHDPTIQKLVQRYSKKYGVRILSLANVGNHLHFHIKLGYRRTYPPFIRALTGALALAVTKASKKNKLKEKFWDYRPFTRIIQSFRTYLNMRDYISINQLEGLGVPRAEARMIIVRRAADTS